MELPSIVASMSWTSGDLVERGAEFPTDGVRAQGELVELAHGGDGQFVEDRHGLGRGGAVGHPFARPVAQVVLGHRGAGREGDVGDGYLAGVDVGAPDRAGRR